MIYGIGTDLLRISRGDHLWERFGEHAAEKLLHPRERLDFEQSLRRGHFLARAFAVKEAFVKALGTGFIGVGFADVGVIREPKQRPQLVFSPVMQARLNKLGICAAHLSLSDEAEYIVAFVVLETAEAPACAPLK